MDRRAGGRDRGRRPTGWLPWCAGGVPPRARFATGSGRLEGRRRYRDDAVAPTARSTNASVCAIARSRSGPSAGTPRPDRHALISGTVTSRSCAGKAPDSMPAARIRRRICSTTMTCSRTRCWVPAREHRPQLRAGGQVVHPRQRGLLADVRLELLGRVLDVVQRALQRGRVLLGLVRDEPEQEGLLVGEVVVDGGASDAGGGRDLGERDRVEPLVGHERREGREELLAGLLAVLVQGPADDLGHRDIIARSVIKWRREAPGGGR